MTERSIVTLDFETYFSKEYSLRSKDLNTSSYIRSPEFKVQCLGIKIDDNPAIWVRDRDVADMLDAIDWANSAVLCHHAQFDGLILSHHYGIVPAFYYDTLSMARALHSNSIGAGLDEVARFYKLGNKLPDVLDRTKGVRELDDDLMKALGEYCAVDTQLCRALFDRMRSSFPQTELNLIDLTVRMFCDPVLRVDIPRVQQELQREQAEKAETIRAAGVAESLLTSSEKFAQELKCSGVLEPPRKISRTTGKPTWAFSKTDLEFTELLRHENERVRRLVRARLAAKSTIGESRAQRFLEAGRDGHRLPVYLSYFGAHTGRWSGGNKLNMQNLPRGGELRRSILAPEGHVIVVSDSAQIEARTLAWLAGDNELLQLFAAGADVYKHMAAQIYGIPIDQVTKEQRFIGKIATLGLGYGMGHAKFRHTLAAGAMGPAVFVSEFEAQRIVGMYRQSRYKIKVLWYAMNSLLGSLARKTPGYAVPPLVTDDEYRVWLPNGLFLRYPFLDARLDDYGEFTDFKYYDLKEGARRKMLGLVRSTEQDEKETKIGKRIYGGLFTENVVQALARIIVADQMLEISNRLKETGSLYGANPDVGYVRQVVTMSHDEVVVVVPEAEAEATQDMMLSVMRTPPAWAPCLPLNAEASFDVNYSK